MSQSDNSASILATKFPERVVKHMCFIDLGLVFGETWKTPLFDAVESRNDHIQGQNSVQSCGEPFRYDIV